MLHLAVFPIELHIWRGVLGMEAHDDVQGQIIHRARPRARTTRPSAQKTAVARLCA